MSGRDNVQRGETRSRETGLATTAHTGGSPPLLGPYDLVLREGEPLVRADRTLEFRALDHIGLRVPDIRSAEAFYHELFQMDVVVRARRVGERWEELPADLDWDEGIRTGVYPDLVFVRHGPIGIVLINAGAGSVPIDPRLDHISLRVSPGTLATLRATVLVRSFTILRDEPRSFQFRDPFGITWHLTDEDE